jgi:hypothetical protein
MLTEDAAAVTPGLVLGRIIAQVVSECAWAPGRVAVCCPSL